MAVSIYPTSVLPLPRSQLDLRLLTGLSYRDAPSGYARVTGCCGKTMFDTSFTLELVGDELQAFEDWYTLTLNYGQNQFTITMDTGSGLEDHLCQMLDIPQRAVEHAASATVSFKVRILDRPNTIGDLWAAAFAGIPCLWPQGYVPSPEVGILGTRAFLFGATDGVATGRRFLSQRGTNYILSVTCSKEEFNYFLKWFDKCLLHGRNWFQATFPTLGSDKVFCLKDSPSVSMSSDFYKVGLSVFCKE